MAPNTFSIGGDAGVSRFTIRPIFGVLALAILFPLATSAQTEQNDELEEIKIRVAKLGIQQKSPVKVMPADKTNVTGVITEVQADNFSVSDRKSNAIVKIPYTEVAKFSGNPDALKRALFGPTSKRRAAIGIATFLIGWSLLTALLSP